MKREDFRDALKLAVLQVAKRFNRKLTEADLAEYVDDLMYELRPKELAQLPKLLAHARRDNKFFPTTGEIRAGVTGRSQYAEITDAGRLLPVQDKPPDWEQMTAAGLEELTEKVKAAAIQRQRELNERNPRPQVRAQKARPKKKRAEFARLGEGMTEEQFREMLRKQQEAARQWAAQHSNAQHQEKP